MRAYASALAWEVGAPSWLLGSGARSLREDNPELHLSQAWDKSAWGWGGNSGHPQGGSGSHPTRVLANQPLEVAGWSSRGRGLVWLRGPHRPEAEPSMGPALGQHFLDFPGLQGYCPIKGHAAGGVSDMPGVSPGSELLGPFPWA